MNHASLNVANALGAWLGGLVIAAGHGYRAPALVGVGLSVAGFADALVASRRAPRARPHAAPRGVTRHHRVVGRACASSSPSSWSLPVSLTATPASADVPHRPTPAVTGRGRRRAAGSWTRSGRVLVLHGVNMVYKRPPYAPDKIDFDRDDARFLARNGFRTVRLGLIWKAVEPRPGKYDDRYLARIARTAEILADEGIWTMLDFHQDLYNERFQGEGAPDWAVLDGGLPAEPQLGFPFNYFAMPALNLAFDNFWRERRRARAASGSRTGTPPRGRTPRRTSATSRRSSASTSSTSRGRAPAMRCASRSAARRSTPSSSGSRSATSTRSARSTSGPRSSTSPTSCSTTACRPRSARRADGSASPSTTTA